MRKEIHAVSVVAFKSVMCLYAVDPHRVISVAHFPASYSMTLVDMLEYVTSFFFNEYLTKLKTA